MLWRKLPGSRSAGRVQSVALRIIVDREIEIERFNTQEYWQIRRKLAVNGGEFEARLTELDGQKLQKFSLPNAEAAARALAAVKAGSYRVAQRRSQARQAQSAAALHDLDAATGSRAQARLLRQPHHADRPAPL